MAFIHVLSWNVLDFVVVVFAVVVYGFLLLLFVCFCCCLLCFLVEGVFILLFCLCMVFNVNYGYQLERAFKNN